MEGSPQQPNLAVQISPELASGRYANILGVWHTMHEFTLDFSVTMPAVASSDPSEPPTLPCEVVARVKVAPSLVFDLLQALNANMTRYEAAYGDIRRPGEQTDADNT